MRILVTTRKKMRIDEMHLLSDAHFGTAIVLQRLQEHLVIDSFVILEAEDLRQSDLPGRVSGQLQVRTECDQQVWLSHDALRKLCVNQLG